MKRWLAGALLTALMSAAPAVAQESMPAPNCPADAGPLPAPLAAWATRRPLAAAGDANGLAAAMVRPGQAVDLALKPTRDVHYALRPERPGGSVSQGGMVAFTVAAAGTYRVALGSGPWIDVVRDGRALTSAAHGQGPACSGIRKMVDFTLTPGNYVLQIVGSGQPALSVMIAQLP